MFKPYGVRFTEPGVGKYLKGRGLAFQRPDKRAVGQDPEAVRLWHEETWPAIRSRATAENGGVLFADQVGIRPDQVTGRTWGAKGTTPVVRRTGNRFSVNAVSAVSTRDQLRDGPLPGNGGELPLGGLDRRFGQGSRVAELAVGQPLRQLGGPGAADRGRSLVTRQQFEWSDTTRFARSRPVPAPPAIPWSDTRPDGLRSHSGLARPSLDAGFEEFSEFIPRRRLSSEFSAFRSRISTEHDR